MRIDEVKKPPTWVRISALSGDNRVDPITPFELKLNNAVKPMVEEPAMAHPFNTSTIKIRNNGMIDMFVGTDQGIRIDPNTKTINQITDGLKEHLNYFRAWVTNDLEWWAKQSFLFDSEWSSITMNAYSGIYSNTDGPNAPIRHNATGDITENAGGHILGTAAGNIKENAGASITETANSHITNRAGGYHWIVASNIYQDSDGGVYINAGGSINLKAGGNVNIQAGGTVTVNGSTIRLNG